MFYSSYTNFIFLTASLKEQNKTHKVIFSKTKKSLAIGRINGESNDRVIVEDAIIINEDSPKITNLKVKFTESNQAVTYTFYVHNIGEKNSYLKNIIYTNVKEKNNYKYCTNNLKETIACEEVTIETVIDNLRTTGSKTNINDVVLEKNNYIPITISITNKENSYPVNVTVGDIYFNFNDK